MTNLQESQNWTLAWAGDTDSGVSDGVTKYWPADGSWAGGIAIKDTLGCSTLQELTTVTQTIKVGGIVVEPSFIMNFDMGASNNNDKITKKAGH